MINKSEQEAVATGKIAPENRPLAAGGSDLLHNF